MEKLIEKFLEIFPDLSHEAAEGSVLNILDSVRTGQEVAIPGGSEEVMGELIAMAKEHIASETTSEEAEEAPEAIAPEASEAEEASE